jgi:hypothetical protein
MVPKRAFGLKLTGALVPGKLGISGLTNPLVMVDLLSFEGFLDDLLICLFIILNFLFF